MVEATSSCSLFRSLAADRSRSFTGQRNRTVRTHHRCLSKHYYSFLLAFFLRRRFFVNEYTKKIFTLLYSSLLNILNAFFSFLIFSRFQFINELFITSTTDFLKSIVRKIQMSSLFNSRCLDCYRLLWSLHKKYIQICPQIQILKRV